MQKIITLFQRNYDGDHLVRNEVVPGAEWVLAGEGRATEKFDGSRCMISDAKLYRRHEVKNGDKFPEGFQPTTEFDPVTQKIQGWAPVGDGPADKWHREAFDNFMKSSPAVYEDGTYELVGPKIQGNPLGYDKHLLIKHGCVTLPNFPRTFDEIKAQLRFAAMEGVVWHHPDGRMVKIKKRDFWKPGDTVKHKPQPENSATIDCLNAAFNADPQAIHALVVNRVPCNDALADDTFVIVDESPVLPAGSYSVGSLGLVNAVLAANGLPIVATKWSDETDSEGRRKLIGFCNYKPTPSDS